MSLLILLQKCIEYFVQKKKKNGNKKMENKVLLEYTFPYIKYIFRAYNKDSLNKKKKNVLQDENFYFIHLYL